MRRDSLLWPGTLAVLALLLAAATWDLLEPLPPGQWSEPFPFLPHGGFEILPVLGLLMLVLPLLGLGTIFLCGPELWRRGGWARWIALAALGIAIGLPLYLSYTVRYEPKVGRLMPRPAPGVGYSIALRPTCGTGSPESGKLQSFRGAFA